jgi:peptidyl-prolyl cis-trans isomerase B (cyclophilin B)
MSCAAKKDYLITIKTSLGDIQLVLYDDTPLHKNNFVALAKAGRYNGTTFHRVIKEFMVQGGDVNTKEGTSPSPDAMIPEEIHPHNFHVRGAVAAARTNNPERKSSECQFYIVQGRTWTEQELTLDQERLTQYLRKLLGMPEYQELRQEFINVQQSGDIKAIETKMNELRPVIENEFEISLTKSVPEDRLEAYTNVGGAPHLDDEYTVFGRVLEGMEVIDAIADQTTNEMDKPIEDISMVVEVEELRRSKISKLYGYQYPSN